ncbi:MAG: S1-like domain-containing RNA-binding protein [Candidatus Azobacteroides sp.]|nr:S1-like domain-containing RNA-binding protein [Candidatus Azobacteroides sp.]
MFEIGKVHVLEVVKHVDFGVYLDGGEAGEILLPNRYVPDDAEVGMFLEVFIYLDHDERLIATTQMPLAQVGEFACLEVVSVDQIGAFLDWGLMKHLLVPFREQKKTLKEGDTPVVYIYIDEKSHRITATAKIDKYIQNENVELQSGEEVNLLIYKKTDLGYNAIINNTYAGLIYENEIFQPVHIGMKTTGFVKRVREDGKVDLSLSQTGIAKMDRFEQIIQDKLVQANGFLPYTDKSDAEEIYDFFQMSKKNFKKAIGGLYKKRVLIIEKDGIKLS